MSIADDYDIDPPDWFKEGFNSEVEWRRAMTEKKKRLVKFVGKCLYAQVYPGQERAPHPEAVKTNPHTAEDRSYVITVECSEDLYKRLIKAGVSRMTVLKEVEGRTYITVKGSKKKTSKNTGEVWVFDDPIVVDANDEPMTNETLIGNGSDVEVMAELADVNHFKALRLQSVKVLNLVPYTKKATPKGEVELEEGNRNSVEKPKENDPDDSFF